MDKNNKTAMIIIFCLVLGLLLFDYFCGNNFEYFGDSTIKSYLDGQIEDNVNVYHVKRLGKDNIEITGSVAHYENKLNSLKNRADALESKLQTKLSEIEDTANQEMDKLKARMHILMPMGYYEMWSSTVNECGQNDYLDDLHFIGDGNTPSRLQELRVD